MSRKTDIEELRSLTPLSALQQQRAMEQDQELDQGLQALIGNYMLGKTVANDPYNYMLNAYEKLPPATPMTERYPGWMGDYMAKTGAKPSTRIQDRRNDLPLYGPWQPVTADWDQPPPPWLNYPDQPFPEKLPLDPAGMVPDDSAPFNWAAELSKPVPALPYPTPQGPPQTQTQLEQWPKDTEDRSWEYP